MTFCAMLAQPSLLRPAPSARVDSQWVLKMGGLLVLDTRIVPSDEHSRSTLPSHAGFEVLHTRHRRVIGLIYPAATHIHFQTETTMTDSQLHDDVLLTVLILHGMKAG